MKALRIALAVLGGLVVVLIVAALILINTFDPNSLKDNMTSWVKERTGRDLEVAEDIELSLFPWFAVETGGISLSDDPAFGDRDFIRIDSLSARIRVLPLLRRQVEVGRVVVDGVELNLGVDAAERGNWSTLLPEASAGDAAADADAERPLERLAVEGIELRNGQVQWYDATGALRYVVSDLALVTGGLEGDAPVDLTLSLTAQDVTSELKAALEVEAEAARAPAPALRDATVSVRLLEASGSERAATTIRFDEASYANGRLQAGATAISARMTGTSPDASGIGDTPGIEIESAFTRLDLDTANETFAVDGLTLGTAGIEAAGDIAGTGLLSAPQFRGNVEARGTTIAALFELLGRPTPAELAGTDAGGFSASADIAVGLSPPTVTVDRFALAALGLEASGNMALGTDGRVTAHIDVPAARPDERLRALLASRLPADIDLAGIDSLGLSTDLLLSADANRLELNRIALALNAARIGGNVVITGLAEPASIQGQISATGIDNAMLTTLLGSRLPAKLLDADIGELRLSAGFDYTPRTDRFLLDPLGISAYGITGNGRLAIETGGGTLQLSGQARLDPFSPRALLTRFDLPVPASSDPRALGRAELATSFATTGSSGSFRDIALVLDDSRITGDFSVENFADPLYRFALRADRIDADRYLPPKAAPTPGDGATTPANAPADATPERRLGDIRLANDALTATRLDGSVSVGELRIGGMRFEQLATDLAIGDGRAALSSVRTALYGGNFEGGFELDTTGPTPSVHLRGVSNTLGLDPLLRDMLGASYVSGTGSFDLDLTGHGVTIGQATSAAAGTMSVTFRDGELRGINLGHGLCKAINLARQLPAPPAAPDATAYQIISASATVAGGVATTENLHASTGYLELTGRGTMQLADQTLDMDFVTRLTGPVNLAGCERLNDRVDRSIPIGFSLEGRLPTPTPTFDVVQLVQDLIRRELRNQAEDAVEDAFRRLLER